MDELLLSKPYEAMTAEELLALKSLNSQQYTHIQEEIKRRLMGGEIVPGYTLEVKRK